MKKIYILFVLLFISNFVYSHTTDVGSLYNKEFSFLNNSPQMYNIQKNKINKKILNPEKVKWLENENSSMKLFSFDLSNEFDGVKCIPFLENIFKKYRKEKKIEQLVEIYHPDFFSFYNGERIKNEYVFIRYALGLHYLCIIYK